MLYAKVSTNNVKLLRTPSKLRMCSKRKRAVTSLVTMRALAPGKLGYLALIHAARRWKWTFCGPFEYTICPVFFCLCCRTSRYATIKSSGTESGGFLISPLHPPCHTSSRQPFEPERIHLVYSGCGCK